MNEIKDNVVGILDPVSEICVAQIHEVGGHHHHLFNIPGLYEAVSQSFKNVITPRSEHILR